MQFSLLKSCKTALTSLLNIHGKSLIRSYKPRLCKPYGIALNVRKKNSKVTVATNKFTKHRNHFYYQVNSLTESS
jgi:hypothetical protein